jgi:hypothetical protein
VSLIAPGAGHRYARAMSDHDDEKNEERPKPNAKDELFEAIDHFKNAASILFDRAAKDPGVRSATKEAEKILDKINDAAEPVVKKVGEAAEPLAKQLTGELSKLTRNVLDAVEGKRKSDAPPPAKKKSKKDTQEEE